MMKENYLKIASVSILFILFIITRYYHSFFSNAEGYGSGDAYGVILNAYNIENESKDYYLVSYFYKIAHELLNIPYNQLSFYITPIVGFLIILMLVLIVNKKFGVLTASLTGIILTLNPWLAYNSTEPSKELYVVAFFILSIFPLFMFENKSKYVWLVSYFLFSVGILFYHSILLFLPFYLGIILLITKKSKKGQVLLEVSKKLLAFIIVSTIISSPPYIIREIKQKELLNQKPKVLISDVDQQGNIFQRQLGAMIYALEKDREKLGFTNLTYGVQNYILNNTSYFLLFLLSLSISIYIALKKNEYIPIFFTILTIYIYFVLGIQFTSYSHGSRYPQYVIYFFLVSVSLPVSWSITLLKSNKLKTLSLTLLIIAIFHMSDPFRKVDTYRSIYIPQRSVGILAKKEGVQINNDSKILYIGWPSTTLSLLERYNLKNTDYFKTFGWGSVNLEGIASKEFISENKIKYFIYDTNGADYFNSNEQVFANLKEKFKLIPITDDNKKSIIIYKIEGT